MKKAILLSLLFSFIFVGCTQKEQQVVFKDKLVCINQQKVERPQSTKIRVHDDDADIAIAYSTAIDSSLSFYEKQVNRNNEFCKGVNK